MNNTPHEPPPRATTIRCTCGISHDMDIVRGCGGCVCRCGATVRITVAAAPDPAEQMLRKALDIVTGARRQAYGTPEDNFQCIADLWSTYLSRVAGDSVLVSAGDVAAMMVLMKAARLAETPTHEDSAVDIAGYAACLRRIQVRDEAAR